MDSSSRTDNDASVSCRICLSDIQSKPSCKEEEKKVLDCSHIFHRECIGEWLKQKHNCPICRASVNVDTPEAPRPDMTLQEILDVPDVIFPTNRESTSRILYSIQNRDRVIHFRSTAIVNLNAHTHIASVAGRVNSVAVRIFGWQ